MAGAVPGEQEAGRNGRGVLELLFALGWRSGADRYSQPPAQSPTLEVLAQMAGAARIGRRRIQGGDFAVAATARAVIRRR
ncbi:hypothetical protein [Aeromicrobium sp.]|uniref:hypothetical protein n=1 Tax=Aeromicrobium sp. TaxID=1871063 RepID=UPI0025C34BB2|nr:hypothetical protein [Aeromicrobium sp.]